MLLAKANVRATMGSRCLLAQTIVVVAPAVQGDAGASDSGLQAMASCCQEKEWEREAKPCL